MLNPETPPEIQAARWFNIEEPPTLEGLKGKVVVLAAFQMHCPGSLKHGLPQAERIAGNFNADEVAVIALNSAFEQHAKQTEEALAEFVEAQELSIPVARDQPNGSGLPKTFEAYELQGTPAILVFDRQGRLRRHYLGQVDDLRLGAEIMALVIEAPNAPREQSIALERRLASALVDPDAHHHEGGCCGGHGHDHHHHHHHHDHDHAHSHGEGGCCGGAHQAHGHHHGHHANEGGCCGGSDAHDHDHDHAHPKGTAKAGCDGKGGCGCSG